MSLYASSMRLFVLRLARIFSMFLLIPFCVGFIGAYSAGAGVILFLLAIPLAALGLLIVSIYSLIKGIRAAQETSHKAEKAGVILASPCLLLVTLAFAWPLMGLGSHLGDLTRLAVNQTAYQRIIAQARSAPNNSETSEYVGITYWVDHGPPVRVAFNPEGMLDNWSGIIYDPTGDVMQADGFDPVTGRFYYPDRITKLFGGDLVSCRHLWGDYFTCSFT